MPVKAKDIRQALKRIRPTVTFQERHESSGRTRRGMLSARVSYHVLELTEGRRVGLSSRAFVPTS